MLTNGQDQSTANWQQRELGRQGLERDLQMPLQSASQPAQRGPARPSVLFGIKDQRMLAELRGRLLGRQSARNFGVEHEPATERKGYAAGFFVGSRQKLRGLAEGYKRVCERWSLDSVDMVKLLHLEEEVGLCDLILSGQVPAMTGDLKDRMALVIGISIGLGEVFDDDKVAEIQWLNSKRSEFGDVSPLEHMLKGNLLNIRDVVGLVDNARGLR